MMRSVCKPSSLTFSVTLLLAAALAAATASSPAGAQVVHPAILPAAAAASAAVEAPKADDDSEDASPLMVMGDFNRDGIADMAQVILPAGGHSEPGFLMVSLGQANGSYRQIAARPMVGRAPKDIVVGDFNGDGMADVIVGDDDGELMLFVGDGTGKLTAAGDIAHLDSVVSIVVGDFNHDGVSDVAVTDWRATKVTILLGAGKGAFRDEGSFPLRMPGTTPHLAIADFNGDGIPDLVVVYDDDEGDTFDVMLGTGKGTFAFAPQLSLARDPNSHCVT